MEREMKKIKKSGNKKPKGKQKCCRKMKKNNVLEACQTRENGSSSSPRTTNFRG